MAYDNGSMFETGYPTYPSKNQYDLTPPDKPYRHDNDNDVENKEQQEEQEHVESEKPE